MVESHRRTPNTTPNRGRMTQQELLARALRRFGDTSHWTPLGWMRYAVILWIAGALLLGLATGAVDAIVPSTHGANAVHRLAP